MTGSAEAIRRDGDGAPDCGPGGLRDRAERLFFRPEPGPERRLWWFGVGHGLAAAGLGVGIGLLIWIPPLWSHPVSREGYVAGQHLMIGVLLACFCLGGGLAVWRLKASDGRHGLWRQCLLALAGGGTAVLACGVGMTFASLVVAIVVTVRLVAAADVLQSGLVLLLCLVEIALLCLLSGFMAVETARHLREPAR